MFLCEKHGAPFGESERRSMATYHCQIKAPRQKSAGKHADYVQCEGRYKGKLEEREHVEHGNMPTWAQDNPKDFWKAADEFERANGQTYKEIEVALPRELTTGQRQELVREFVNKELSAHAYTWAIHNKKASDGQMQPHAHIMFSPRQQDKIERSREQYFKRANGKEPAKGGCKKSDRWAGSLSVQAKNVEKVRERWAVAVNRSYEKAGRVEKVDHRSLADQGIDRKPEKHMGPTVIEMENRGELTDRRAFNQSVKAYNRGRSIVADLAAAKQQETTIKSDITRLEVSATVAQGNAARIRQQLDQVKPVEVFRPVTTAGSGQSEALPPLPLEPKATPQQPASKPLAVDPSFELGAAGEPSFDVGVARNRLTQIDGEMDLISRKHQPSAEEREAHKAAYMKPFTDRKLAYNQSVNGFNRDFKAWQKDGVESGWTYKEPLKPDASWLDKKQRQVVEAMQSKEERAWQVQGNRLDRRRVEIVTEKENCERFKGQREEDYRTRGTQEFFIATRRKIEAVPEYQKLQTEKNAINAAIREHKKAIEKTLDKDRGMGRSR